jgi:hypothetical protein
MSEPDNEQLREMWAALPGGEPVPGCAPPEEIWTAVQGEASQAQVRALLQHSLLCAECATLWRLARELSAVAPAASLPVSLQAWTTGRRWLLGGGALAAAAILAVAFWPVAAPRQDSVVLRGNESAALRPVPGEEVLQRAHPILRWTGAPAGSRYGVSVSTQDLTMLYRASGLSTPEVELPAAALAPLPPGATVVWRVEATLPDGRVLKSTAFLSRLE